MEVIRALHSLGFSFRDIARCIGAGYGTVRRAYHGLVPLGADLIGKSIAETGQNSPARSSKPGKRAMSAAR